MKRFLAPAVFFIFLTTIAFAESPLQAGSGDRIHEFRSVIATIAGKMLLYAENGGEAAAFQSAADRHARTLTDDVLSEAIRFVNSSLVMIELQEYTDRRPRVKELILTWMQSGRQMIQSRLQVLNQFERLDDLSLDAVQEIEAVKDLLNDLDGAFGGIQQIYEA